MMLRGLLLDVDGTLVDSNDAHARAFVEAFAEFGKDVPFERVRQLIGMGSEKLMPAAADVEVNSDLGKQVSDRKSEIFKSQYLPHLQPFPRVRDLLLRLRDRGLQLVAASSAHEDELKALLEIAGAADLLNGRTSASDVENAKPAPDIVLAAIEKIGLPHDQVALLGDTPYDMEAAQRAGVAFLGVRCGGWHDPDLSGALALYNDPADLLARVDEPPFRPNGQ